MCPPRILFRCHAVLSLAGLRSGNKYAEMLKQPVLMSVVGCAVALAHIAKGLVQAKPLALEAYRLLSCILAVPMQPIARHKKILGVLAEMQGVRRLSNLLCPTLDSKGSPEFASGRVPVSLATAHTLQP